MQNAWAIGLYSYSSPNPSEIGFQKFYETVLTLFREVGIKPTYFAAEGTGYNGHLTKFGGRTHTKALKSGFSEIKVMSLVANPEGSEEPGYDCFASASLAYVEETSETLLCLMLEERLLGPGGVGVEDVLKSLVALYSWDFGYALSQPTEKKPEFHILGLDGGKISADDRRRLNAWYASTPEERLRKIRDIYPFIVLNKVQLSNRLLDSRSLEEFIRSDSGSELSRLAESSLWLWRIQPDAVSGARDILAASDILIT
jgi:hypothetical protein